MPTSHEDGLNDLKDELTRIGRLADKHEYELNGPRGVYRAILELAEQLKWNNRALWAIAATAIAGALLAALGLDVK